MQKSYSLVKKKTTKDRSEGNQNICYLDMSNNAHTTDTGDTHPQQRSHTSSGDTTDETDSHYQASAIAINSPADDSDLPNNDANDSELPNNDAESSSEESKHCHPPIDVCSFFINLLLGFFYLGIAVIFILVVYLNPLASEDLFNYLFNVIQFMIVVVSTQFVYKFLAGNKFTMKRVIKTIFDDKNIKEVIDKYKIKEKCLAEKTGKFIAKGITVSHVVKKAMEETTEM